MNKLICIYLKLYNFENSNTFSVNKPYILFDFNFLVLFFFNKIDILLYINFEIHIQNINFINPKIYIIYHHSPSLFFYI